MLYKRDFDFVLLMIIIVACMHRILRITLPVRQLVGHKYRVLVLLLCWTGTVPVHARTTGTRRLPILDYNCTLLLYSEYNVPGTS